MTGSMPYSRDAANSSLRVLLTSTQRIRARSAHPACFLMKQVFRGFPHISFFFFISNPLQTDALRPTRSIISPPRIHHCKRLHGYPVTRKHALHFTALRLPPKSHNTKSVIYALFNTLRTGSFKLFTRPFPGFLTILTL